MSFRTDDGGGGGGPAGKMGRLDTNTQSYSCDVTPAHSHLRCVACYHPNWHAIPNGSAASSKAEDDEKAITLKEERRSPFG